MQWGLSCAGRAWHRWPYTYCFPSDVGDTCTEDKQCGTKICGNGVCTHTHSPKALSAASTTEGSPTSNATNTTTTLNNTAAGPLHVSSGQRLWDSTTASEVAVTDKSESQAGPAGTGTDTGTAPATPRTPASKHMTAGPAPPAPTMRAEDIIRTPLPYFETLETFASLKNVENYSEVSVIGVVEGGGTQGQGTGHIISAQEPELGEEAAEGDKISMTVAMLGVACGATILLLIAALLLNSGRIGSCRRPPMFRRESQQDNSGGHRDRDGDGDGDGDRDGEGGGMRLQGHTWAALSV